VSSVAGWLEKISYFSHVSRAFSQRTKPSFMDVPYFPHAFPMIFANGQRGPIQKLELSVIRPPVFIQLCSHGNEPAMNHQLPSGKHTQNNGTSPFYSWVNKLFKHI
jgi:hypothetical protein